MKRYVSVILSLCLVLMLIGCSQSPAETPETSVPASSESLITQPQETTLPMITEPVNLSGPMTAVSLPAVTEATTAENGQTIFYYTHQTMALTHSAQAAADHIIVDFLNRVDTTRATAESILSSAQSAYSGSSEWIPYLCQVTYNPMRIDRGILSLFGSIVTYSGAMHPDQVCISANYDLLTGDVLTLGSILTDESVIEDLCQLTIDHLNAIAAEKYLRSGFESDVRRRFEAEASYDEDWFFSNTGLCFYFSPYELAPYSSGVIIAEIPYSELVGIIMDDYFPAEQHALSGTVSVAPFSTENAESFTQISELILDKESNMFLLSCDSSVENLRIIVNDSETDLQYVAYAAQYLNPGDAIMLQYDTTTADEIHVEYLSNGNNTTLAITP